MLRNPSVAAMCSQRGDCFAAKEQDQRLATRATEARAGVTYCVLVSQIEKGHADPPLRPCKTENPLSQKAA